ncbi:Phosphate-selective porin O and P OS=Pirellula staleyi (strain ATCC 27377 / DSM 6068 / ICPB 4128) GN=Psta_0512 PE=4 SV=1: Porin_O_P [Gemmataceae bacterium]|nr:Phosphate-selective porin O and P OS=Pirellula staleyi (strain ATCC 27377 / DSM 6068 / ICPB 4128) GN=Psta_0512 PE=4 SV=1: Porin_O_P [Gemmataceae bacterium]VTU00471.1 Phosphate-selective porin O and P OS=Pirellula staleyi (strain ATCC 27377 / DSM 6068 / ICPB 4128) GN=Psta_0512 PE=4 SV=1: Porin_O_P [Gemmataceae bacterium]
MKVFVAARRGGWGAAAALVWSIVSGAAAGQAPVAPEGTAPLAPPTVLLEPGTPVEPATGPESGTALSTLLGEEPAPPPAPPAGGAAATGRDLRLYDRLHCDDNYGVKSLFDSLHQPGAKGKAWYEKYSIRGYAQPRFGRTLYQTSDSAAPNLVGDRSINGNAEDFFVRRARFILFGDVSDYLSLYTQYDFAVTLPGVSTSAFFSQLRDFYGDVYLNKDRVNRFRIGLSKVPYGFENMQSSQNRVPLDRTDAINSGVSFNERDLGVFYYWTPTDKQKLLKDLVDGGLKGSGNYGIFALGVYNGQGLAVLEQNLQPHVVARFTWPFQLPSGQVVEASVQGYTGMFVVPGSDIRIRGEGDSATPDGTGGNRGYRDQRIAGTFVWYPQPFGFQSEWNVGRGPGLSEAQDRVETRSLQGGYAMVMYKWDTGRVGNVIPYTRYQYYKGGYKVLPNAPYGTHKQWDIGTEWHFRKEMELTLEYSIVDGLNVNAIDRDGALSYRNFRGGVLRTQFQINY